MNFDLMLAFGWAVVDLYGFARFDDGCFQGWVVSLRRVCGWGENPVL